MTVRGGLRLSYASHGEGPAVVLLPGPTDSWRSYEPVLERLPSSIRAIAVSQRGHGDSDKPATGYEVEDFAADVISLLDTLDIRQAVLVGHSGSCPVVRRVAVDHPDRVTGLVLEASPTTLVGDAGFQEFVTAVVSGLEDPIDPGLARAFVVATSPHGIDPAVLDQFVDDLLQVPARVWRETFGALLRYDDTHLLGRIAAPTLLIWGDADELVARPMQDELVARIPGATLTIYSGVGHSPRWEDPSRFTRDVVEFVARSGPR
ncbi:alpha/beta fold hydrolase [Xylanimonas cellulosilytica]|uniref:alpha/beta fold hydrolase n=1 Tax=Xylanimonas cellulosilytica TaxID=186189 RepID=UPI00019C02BB|nr:alpha/beta hydrolase [Xylanimonas cellulosilytica]